MAIMLYVYIIQGVGGRGGQEGLASNADTEAVR